MRPYRLTIDLLIYDPEALYKAGLRAFAVHDGRENASEAEIEEDLVGDDKDDEEKRLACAIFELLVMTSRPLLDDGYEITDCQGCWV